MEHRRALERLTEVTLDELGRVGDRREVQRLVVFQHRARVARKRRDRYDRQIDAAVRRTRTNPGLECEPAERIGERRVAQHTCSPGRRSRCTASSASAAGVMPQIREACPSVAGRTCPSFSDSSADNPGNPS